MGGRNLLSRLLLAVPAIVLIDTGAAVAQEAVTLRMILVSPEDRWNTLLDAAREKFAAEHPDVELSLDVQILPFGDRLTQLRAAAIAGTPLDIVSLDQPPWSASHSGVVKWWNVTTGAIPASSSPSQSRA